MRKICLLWVSSNSRHSSKLLQHPQHLRLTVGNAHAELLSAAISALAALKEPCQVLLTTDSQYLVNGMEKGWAKKWRANGWRKSDKSPALNADLWQQLLELCEIHAVTFRWVKGHAGHPENERCDKLAVDYYTAHFSR